MAPELTWMRRERRQRRQEKRPGRQLKASPHNKLLLHRSLYNYNTRYTQHWELQLRQTKESTQRLDFALDSDPTRGLTKGSQNRGTSRWIDGVARLIRVGNVVEVAAGLWFWYQTRHCKFD